MKHFIEILCMKKTYKIKLSKVFLIKKNIFLTLAIISSCQLHKSNVKYLTFDKLTQLFKFVDQGYFLLGGKFKIKVNE